MKQARSAAGLARYLRTIQQEGQGVWRIELFDCIGMPEFLLEVLVKGPPTTGFAKTVFDMARGLATGRDKCDCLLCGTTFSASRMPRDMAALHAWRDEPKQALGFCICNGCHDDDQRALAGRITDYLKANLISDLRVLPSVHHAAAPEQAQ